MKIYVVVGIALWSTFEGGVYSKEFFKLSAGYIFCSKVVIRLLDAFDEV